MARTRKLRARNTPKTSSGAEHSALLRTKTGSGHGDGQRGGDGLSNAGCDAVTDNTTCTPLGATGNAHPHYVGGPSVMELRFVALVLLLGTALLIGPAKLQPNSTTTTTATYPTSTTTAPSTAASTTRPRSTATATTASARTGPGMLADGTAKQQQQQQQHRQGDTGSFVVRASTAAGFIAALTEHPQQPVLWRGAAHDLQWHVLFAFCFLFFLFVHRQCAFLRALDVHCPAQWCCVY